MYRMSLHRLFVATLVLGIGSGLMAADPGQPEYADRSIDPLFVAMQDPVAPIQPEQPEARIEAESPAGAGTTWGGVSLSDLPTELAASPVAAVVSGEEAALRGTTDVGDLLEQSGETGNVMLFSRSPISNEPRIRGYRFAQIRNTVDGAFFFPIRPDLDTALSRIDSSIIKDVSIIDGPYSVRLGPGFAFINVQMKETERNRCGAPTHGRTASSYDTNGEAWYGAQSFHSGGSNYGYRIGYVQRTGSDYEAGGGFPVAASHNVRNWNFSVGYDPACNSSFEFSYLRNDLTNIDLPSQINDLRILKSDAFYLRYVVEDQYWYDQLRIDGWYNQSNFSGVPSTVSKQATIIGVPADPPDPAQILLFALFHGKNMSTGSRVTLTWGDAETGQLAAGADVTVARQTYHEKDMFEDGTNKFFFYGLTPSRETDTGIFADTILPLDYRRTIKAGGRIDWVASKSAGTLRDTDNVIIPNPDDFRGFTLGAAYITLEDKWSEELTAMVGFGMAQRAPTVTDLFADLPYLAILQEGGGFYVEKNFNLVPETAKQLDVALTMDYDDFHGGIRAFHSWVGNFITYYHLANPIFGNHPVNHDSTLAGSEIYGDLKLDRRLTSFTSLAFVEGRDNVLHEPLWGISPFQGIVGLRLNDRLDGKQWGIEYHARIVANQTRINTTAGFKGEVATPGFVTHDLRGYWHVNHAITVVAGAENFGNRNYQTHLDSRLDTNYGHPGGVFRPGRNFYFLVQSEY